MGRGQAIILATLQLLLTALPGEAVDRPFVLWNRDDINSIRHRIESEDWARRAYQKLIDDPDQHERSFGNLLRYALTGDQETGRKEKKELMRMVASPIPRGGAQYINVIRYDLLYDLLSAEERRQTEECFRVYIDNAVFKRAVFDPNVFNDSRNYSRYDARLYTRSNWLPNIIWPRIVSANLMAAALMDEELIRKVWSAYGSWKWYFDENLSDIGFYSEEFSKMGSTPGAMLIYCRAVERLGLDDLGYGYTGKGGATMRGHIESLIHLGYPRINIGSDRPQYPMLTIGDLRQSGSSQSWNLPSPAFQHSLVMGYTPDGAGGTERWKAHGAWGGTIRGNMPQWDGYTGFTPKMQFPFWFEIGHALWPEVGFDYFLAQMRPPGAEEYYPSLFFGLDPISAAKVTPPPAPSAVWPQRGLVVLRADESPAYWQSPAPAVTMRLASNYAHNVYDCFALTGFYAYNRPIYLNRQVTPGYAQDWSRSIQSHCAVVVDAAEPKFTEATTIRKAFTDPVKFAAARSREVYPGVDLTRALLLTRDYFLDVTHLFGSTPHRYSWFIHSLGQVVDRQPQVWGDSSLPEGLYPLNKVRACKVGTRPWSVTALQNCAFEDQSQARLPKSWYDRRIGVCMRMLGGQETAAYTARTPLIVAKLKDENGQSQETEVPSEVGGVTVVAERMAPATTFVALHEAFENGEKKIVEFRPVERRDDAVAVAVVGVPGSAINDRLMLRLGDNHDRELTVAGGGESFTFADWAWVRIAGDRVEVSGDLRAMRIPVKGQPRVFVGGAAQDASLEDGHLLYHKPSR